MILKKGSTIVMAGDSITDCGRDYNAIPAGYGSFGDGYVSLINAFLTGLAPKEHITIINKGISGNTILDLKERWQKDVLDFKPDYVSIMIGVNDVWRQFDSILQPIEFVDLELFLNTYAKLIERTKKVTEQIFILSPFMIIEDKEYPMRQMVDAYALGAKNLAKSFDLIYVDIQEEMDKFIKELPAYTLSSDHVHPNLQGHAIIAKAFLDAIGFSWMR